MDIKELDKELCFNIHDDIKIYTGVPLKKHNMIDNINFYKNINKKFVKKFTDLIPSTLTAKGSFSNIQFNEEKLINELEEPKNYIFKIGCNFGIKINKNPIAVIPPKNIKKSNRGRKPKGKPKSKRKQQGTGKYFSSQITFDVYNEDVKKIYKIKLFRNGIFQVPGIRNPDMTDLIKPIRILHSYLIKHFNESVKIEYFISVMRNYTCRIINKNYLIKLKELEQIFINYKNKERHAIKRKTYSLESKENDSDAKENDSDAKENDTPLTNMEDGFLIAEIQNNWERFFGLIIKFYRPNVWKKNKKTTVKILQSGKINIDGSNSELEALELYHWLENIFNIHYDEVIYDKTKIESDSSEYDIGSEEPIYDSE